MLSRKMPVLLLCACALGFAMPSAHAQPNNDAPIKVGMAKTFFNDVPPALIGIALEPFGGLMKATTGLKGTIAADDDALGTADKLESNAIQLGVFHGHEFAWAQKKYPKLTPLMIAANKYKDASAFVIVHKDNPATDLKSLRGKVIDIPLGTKQHCRVFLEKFTKDNNQNDPNAFFSKVLRCSSVVDAMDEVCRKNVDAILVDAIWLETYKDLKGPVFTKNLRVLQSESFPSPVIAYKQGSLSDATVATIRDGMIKSHMNPKCKDMLEMWQIDAFESIPKNFSDGLARVLKDYPLPEPTKVSLR